MAMISILGIFVAEVLTGKDAIEQFYGRVEHVEERANDDKRDQEAERLGQSVQSALQAGRSARAAQAPVPLSLATVFGDQPETQPKPKSTGDQDADNQEPKPRETKRQKAQEALAEAKKAHAEATRRAEQAMADLEQFVKSTGKEGDPADAFNEAHSLAAQATAEKMEEANKALKQHLSALSQPDMGGNATSIDKLAVGAEEAANHVQKMHVAQARVARKILAEMQRKAKEQARGLGKEAKHAAHASLKAARALERAHTSPQRRSESLRSFCPRGHPRAGGSYL